EPQGGAAATEKPFRCKDSKTAKDRKRNQRVHEICVDLRNSWILGLRRITIHRLRRFSQISFETRRDARRAPVDRSEEFAQNERNRSDCTTKSIRNLKRRIHQRS